jgi:hypothetical protein
MVRISTRLAKLALISSLKSGLSGSNIGVLCAEAVAREGARQQRRGEGYEAAAGRRQGTSRDGKFTVAGESNPDNYRANSFGSRSL